MSDEEVQMYAAKVRELEGTCEQLAKDVISMAVSGGMPDSYFEEDSRIRRARDHVDHEQEFEIRGDG